MLKFITAAVAGAVLTLGSIAGGVAVATNPITLQSALTVENTPNPTPKWMTTPCEYEDSPNCYWNAGTAGNGQGHSFYSILVHMPNGNMKQCTIYWQNRYAKKHNYCIGL